MDSPSPSADVTRLLREISSGGRGAWDRLLPLVYDELHALASRSLARERPGHTLQATALAHEAYLRLVDQRQVAWTDRAHFQAVAAMAMRRILTDHARSRSAAKRGRSLARVPLERVDDWVWDAPEQLLALDEALTRLEELDPRKARVVELRFFSGLRIEEAAEVLGVSTGTVERDWKTARAWLQAELTRGDPA